MKNFKPGEKVSYIPSVGDPEKGIVKSICDDPNYCFVVYHCANQWDKYQDYTAARTHIKYLEKGWKK